MMSNTIKNWYEFTLAQMAADSYLDPAAGTAGSGTFVKDSDLRDRLTFGANHYNYREQNIADNNLSATQMTEVMIDDFTDTWDIIHHQKNTSSGFSGTLLKHKTSGEYTLSFRSTESKDSDDGGDVERDSTDGANGQITNLGFAYGQILDMETYYQALIDDSEIGLTTNTQLNITGYSLGGHLAQAFTRLHEDNIIHTYTYNGAGFGDLAGVDELTEGGDLASLTASMKQELNQRLAQIADAQANPFAHLSEVSNNELAQMGYPIIEIWRAPYPSAPLNAKYL